MSRRAGAARRGITGDATVWEYPRCWSKDTWLDHAHRALDEAVADAYGWGDDWRAGLLTDDEVLARLFRLNQERANP